MSRARALIFAPIAVAIALLGVRALIRVAPEQRMTLVANDTGDPPTLRTYRAKLHIARGGPVILGFQSGKPSRLTITAPDGEHRLAGSGVIKDRFLLPEGDVELRFVAAPRARLVWSPVGRRGDPEYVPAALLSPIEGTAPASTDSLDGVIALGLLGCVIAFVLIAQRRRLAAVPRETWIAIAAVGVGALVVRLIDIGGAGQTWDEDVNFAAGKNYISNVLALDGASRSWQWNFEHPPIMKYLAGIGAHLTEGFLGARIISAILVALGCALLVPIGKRLYDLRTGIIAGGIAAVLPPLVAHGQIVGHEAPTVLWWTLGLLFALCVHDGLDPDDPRARRILVARLAGVGIVIGIAVASRFVNGLLGPLCVLVVVLRAPDGWRKRTLLWSPVMVGTTLVTFWAVWPRLWAHPLRELSASLTKLSFTHAPEPFLGTLSATPPSYYFAIYLVATLPLGLVLAALVGGVRAGIESSRSSVILVGWLFLPLLVAASPVRQDGVRYVMPCVLALVMIAAVGVNEIAARVGRWKPALFGALGLYLVITLVRIHPYYLDYFGEQVGGPSTVREHRLFETAWWGEGLDRAVAYVNEHARVGEKIDRSCVLPQHLTWFRSDLWPSITGSRAGATWIVEYVGTTPCPISAAFTKVFEVDVAGAPLARVWRARQP